VFPDPPFSCSDSISFQHRFKTYKSNCFFPRGTPFNPYAFLLPHSFSTFLLFPVNMFLVFSMEIGATAEGAACSFCSSYFFPPELCPLARTFEDSSLISFEEPTCFRDVGSPQFFRFFFFSSSLHLISNKGFPAQFPFLPFFCRLGEFW